VPAAPAPFRLVREGWDLEIAKLRRHAILRSDDRHWLLRARGERRRCLRKGRHIVAETGHRQRDQKEIGARVASQRRQDAAEQLRVRQQRRGDVDWVGRRCERGQLRGQVRHGVIGERRHFQLQIVRRIRCHHATRA
jgi:hypothetical protein